MFVRGLGFVALLAVGAHAQEAAPWQGEWGAFTGTHAEVGRRLSIQDCSGNVCKYYLEARSAAGHADAPSDSKLTLQANGTASASLPNGDRKAFCTLQFKRNGGTRPDIEVVASGATCTSYYATSPTVSFSGTYPLHSSTPYGGMHADECFLGQSPALLATCTHPELDTLERQWEALAKEYPLHAPPASQPGGGTDAMQVDRQLLHDCDTEGDPQACLTKRYSGEITQMQAKKTAYLAGTEERGDPAVGGPLARRIAGLYRHSSKNGDVQGDSYITTDKLTITVVGTASIRFKANLYFFNGHSCSLDGGALYRRDGSFVFDDKPANAFVPDTPACRLAIVPDATGVKFKEITGGCKSYCGARGTWNNKGFTFSDRSGAPGKK